MRAGGFEPLEPYPGSGRPWRCRHLASGNIVTPRPAYVGDGRVGCSECAKESRLAVSGENYVAVNTGEDRPVAGQRGFHGRPRPSRRRRDARRPRGAGGPGEGCAGTGTGPAKGGTGKARNGQDAADNPGREERRRTGEDAKLGPRTPQRAAPEAGGPQQDARTQRAASLDAAGHLRAVAEALPDRRRTAPRREAGSGASVVAAPGVRARAPPCTASPVSTSADVDDSHRRRQFSTPACRRRRRGCGRGACRACRRGR